MTLFSIVVPTHNRAHLLRYCLPSVLEQTFNDYEVVVSDNCSLDDTAKFMQSFEHPRLRYVRSETPLNINDSWDFAIANARGEYVTLLPDDDASPPRFLEKLAAVIERRDTRLLCWLRAIYHYAGSNKASDQEHLWIPAFTREVVNVDAQKELARRYTLRFSEGGPLMVNACYHRELIEAISTRAGRFCLPPSAEHTAPAMALGLVERYTFIDEPLTLVGIGLEDSNTVQFLKRVEPNLGGSLSELYSRLPFATNFATNWRMESLLRAQEAIPESLGRFRLSGARYFEAYYGEILYLQDRGVDVSDDLQGFWRVLAQQPPEIQAAVQAAIFPRDTYRTRLRKAVRRIIDGVPLLGRLEHLIRREPVSTRWPVVLYGADVGFSNILECAQQFDAILERIQPDDFAWRTLSQRIP
jgi:glycosyltransferase involved in cell wall biosynthesis